jgi:phage tail tape-measure protein
LSRYRHSETGHIGEEEVEVAHDAGSASERDETISEPGTPKQRPAALHPTKTPAQRSNVSHRSTRPSVNHSDGLAMPTGTSIQSEVSELSRIVIVTTL